MLVLIGDKNERVGRNDIAGMVGNGSRNKKFGFFNTEVWSKLHMEVIQALNIYDLKNK